MRKVKTCRRKATFLSVDAASGRKIVSKITFRRRSRRQRMVADYVDGAPIAWMMLSSTSRRVMVIVQRVLVVVVTKKANHSCEEQNVSM